MLTYSQMKLLTAGRRHRVNEIKSGKKHYGVNIGLGGIGNHNPISGNKIQANGEHGHLYVYYQAPTLENYGGILVGLEGSAPIDAWDNRPAVGHTKGSSQRSGYIGTGILGAQAWLKDKVLHDPTLFAPDQTGGYHKFGERQQYSPTGNAKWEKLSTGPNKEVYNAMIVDFVETGWEFIKTVDQIEPAQLALSGSAPRIPAIHPVPLIMKNTCLTKINLEKMKQVTEQRASDWDKMAKGKTVTMKNYNAPKKNNPLGEYKMEKPMDMVNPMVRQLASNINPIGQSSMTIENWRSFSNLTWSARDQNILVIDDKLRDCLEQTDDSLRYYQSDIDAVVTKDHPFVKYRHNALLELLIKINEYLNKVQKKSSKREPAVQTLKMLILTEMELINKACRDRIT